MEEEEEEEEEEGRWDLDFRFSLVFSMEGNVKLRENTGGEELFIYER